MTPDEYRTILYDTLVAKKAYDRVPHPTSIYNTLAGRLFAEWARLQPEDSQRAIAEAAIHQDGVLYEHISDCADYFKEIYEHHRSH